MAHQIADRVAETSTTTGTGPITLVGALTGFRAFSSVCSVADTLFYAMWQVDSNNVPTGAWETGLGTYSGTNTLTRTTPNSSSNGGAAVSFTAGTLVVTLSVNAAFTPQFGPDKGITFPSAGTTALSTPATNTAQLAARTTAFRQMFTMMAPVGAESLLQPLMARKSVGLWYPPGNATTLPGVFGFTALTAVGTATARNVATTSLATRMRRLGYPSSSTAGTFGGFHNAVSQYTCGSGTPNDGSGFYTVMRWVESDPAAVSGRRAFVGLANATTAFTNVEPNTLTVRIGIMQLSTDATQWYWYGAGSSANGINTAIGTGIGAPAGNSTTAWELAIFAPSNTANTYYLQLTNLTTGVTATTTMTGAATVIPQSTSFLGWRYDLTNNATALACGMDLTSIYVETDY